MCVCVQIRVYGYDDDYDEDNATADLCHESIKQFNESVNMELHRN